MNRIDDSDDRAVDWQWLRLWSEPGTGALDDHDHFTFARPDGIDTDECSPRRHQPGLVLLIDAQRFHDEQLLADHGVDLLRRDDTTCHACKEHCFRPKGGLGASQQQPGGS